ncbi:nuclear pore complex protein DDB_G0274915 [Chironomus tepperi]|uniref:nuclear pore complex protein DDB_G0274915 n=1 Tax=Chironomus tepperi TaxID=113505 RepID=UPI00391F0A61
MGKLLSSLQLQTFLILWIIYSVNGAPYSKYGRTCKDIGCLPRETCVMSYDTCSFNQQEGTNCGRYPTCQKRTDMQTPQQNTNTGPSNPSPPSNPNDNIWNIAITTTTERTTTTTTTTRPTTTTTRWTTRPTTTTTTTRRSWTTKSPFYNPSNPSYGGGGSYFGNRYGDDDIFGGGSSFTRTSTTKRPSSSGSGGFFSGLSSFLGGDVGKLLTDALKGGSGTGGGFFDTRPLIENKNRGGLFSENPSSGSSGSSPTNYNGYPVTRYGSENSAPSYVKPTTSSPTASHGNFGWKLS